MGSGGREKSSNASKLAEEEEKYRWFVSYMLFSAEQVFDAFPDDMSWQAALKDQICHHEEFMAGNQFQHVEKADYGDDFGKFIDKSLEKCSPPAPAK